MLYRNPYMLYIVLMVFQRLSRKKISQNNYIFKKHEISIMIK